jgi:hypothetical protein
MKNFKKVLKNLVDLPIGGHTRDCSVMTYQNRIEIKIPLHFEKITSIPTISYNKEYIKIVWTTANLQRQD